MEIIKHDKNVSHFKIKKGQYSTNRDYQRETDIWSLDDEQYLIDTILNDLDLPKLYFRKLEDKNYEIVDGQQRLCTVWKFLEGTLWIPGEKYSYDKKRVRYDDLSEEHQDIFLNFSLDGRALIDYNDNDTRELFSRLQRGKPLNVPEKLNALPGDIVLLMRNLGKHKFFKKIKFPLSRYKHYHIIAKLLLIEKEGITETQPKKLFDFFELNRDLTGNSNEAKKIRKTLNFLIKVFPEETVPEINSEPWFLNIYILASDLIEIYDMNSKEDDLSDFITKYWVKVEKVRSGDTGSKAIQNFVDANTKGTNSRANIESRFEFLMEKFLKENQDLELLDPNRNFNHYEKTVIWRRDKGKCKKCGKKVKWADYDADHIKAHSKAGATKISNGQILCYKCNRSKGDK